MKYLLASLTLPWSLPSLIALWYKEITLLCS